MLVMVVYNQLWNLEGESFRKRETVPFARVVSQNLVLMGLTLALQCFAKQKGFFRTRVARLREKCKSR